MTCILQTSVPVVAAGVVRCDTARECARGAAVICTCLPLLKHVYEQMVGDDGTMQGMARGSTWVDTSTMDYHNTLRIAAIAKEKGCSSLKAPVSSLSHMGINFCNASYLVGGDKRGWDVCQGFFKETGKISFYIGAIRMRKSAKLLTNDSFYTAVIYLVEMCALVQEAGVPLHWFWDYIKERRANTSPPTSSCRSCSTAAGIRRARC